MEEIQYLVEAEKEGLGLDVYLRENLLDLSRSYLQKLIEDGCITVEGKIRKSSYKVKSHERILVELPELSEDALLLDELTDIAEVLEMLLAEEPVGV